MKHFLTVCAAIVTASFISTASAQINNSGVKQNGGVTANNCAKWTGPNTVADAGAPCAAAASVSSVFGRTGAVAAATNDYSFSQISGGGTGVVAALGNPLNAASGLVGFSGQLGAASATSLSVAGAASSASLSVSGAASAGSLSFPATTGTLTFQGASGGSVFQMGYSDTKLILRGGTAGLQFNNQANSAVLGVLDNSGKLGIGPSGAPTALLDVEGAARIRSLTSGCVSSDASGNLGSTSCGNQFNVISAGADPTGVADSTPAFQSVVNSMQAATNPAGVFIPCGTYKLNSSVTAGNGNFALYGQNKSCVYININFAGVAFAINNTTSIYYGGFENITCQAPAAGATCLQFNGSTANAFITSWVIAKLRCFGLAYCVRNARNVNVSGEAQFNWNHFFDIQTGNYGANATQYAIAHDNGSGTGNVYDGMNLIVAQGGLYWAAPATYNIGDITIANIQFGGAQNAIYGASTAAYKARVTVSNIQCDAGTVTCLNLQSYDHNQYIGVTRSGTANNVLGTPTNQYCGSLAC